MQHERAITADNHLFGLSTPNQMAHAFLILSQNGWRLQVNNPQEGSIHVMNKRYDTLHTLPETTLSPEKRESYGKPSF